MSSIVLQNPRPQIPDPKMSRLGHQVCSHAVCNLVQCAFTVHCRTHQCGGVGSSPLSPCLFLTLAGPPGTWPLKTPV